MLGERFWRWYDRASRADFAGNLLGYIFDWRHWLWGLVPGGSVLTFLWAAIEGRSPLDVWIAAAMVAASLAVTVAAMIWVADKHHGRAKPSTARSPSSLMEDYQAGRWAPSYPPLRGEAPDWPIRELFRHIRPDYPLTASKTVGVATSDDLDNRWNPIGDHVIKQLSLGNLHAAGRKEVYNPIRHLASAPIPQTYWQSAKFSFYFLDRDGKTQEHVVNDDGIRYSDLEVSRAEALKIWPLERWPDFKKWDKQEKFELYEAACLWFNIEPRLPMPDRSLSKYQEWKAMAFSGGLPVDTDSVRHAIEIGTNVESSITPNTRVRREVLRGLAEHDGYQPMFLYPHKRGESGN
jgi:hypothetical protein